MKQYEIPYSRSALPVKLPEERVDFIGTLPETAGCAALKQELKEKLERPTAGPALMDLLRPEQHIVMRGSDGARKCFIPWRPF